MVLGVGFEPIIDGVKVRCPTFRRSQKGSIIEASINVLITGLVRLGFMADSIITPLSLSRKPQLDLRHRHLNYKPSFEDRTVHLTARFDDDSLKVQQATPGHDPSSAIAVTISQPWRYPLID